MLLVAVAWSFFVGVAITLCTSGMQDKVMFSYNEPDSGVTLLEQPRCNVAYILTRLLHCIGNELSWATADAQTRRVRVQGVPGEVCDEPLPCCSSVT